VGFREPGAPFHLLPIRAPRQAGLRISFRLAPSCYRATLRSTDREDARCDEPISAIQSNHVHPHLARSRLRALLAKRGHPAESWAPRSGIPGDQAFSRRPRPLRRVVARHVDCAPLRFPLRVQQRGRCLPTEPCATEPLTPLSRSCWRLPPLPSSRELRLVRASSHGTRVGAGRETVGPPRPPSCVPRERNTLETIRDAFHRQGPFVGSGGLYNPGPATASPLLAMVPPLNGGLPPLWAFSRSSPV
jgi:hypothetical protein